MRTIKFRYYVKPEADICGYFIYSNQRGFKISDETTVIDNFAIVNTSNIQQFTGILDKNGKEIYEGDIVSYNLSHFVKFSAPVVFSPFGYGFVLDSSGRHKIGDIKYGDYVLLCHAEVTDAKYEVVGNIFENKD